MEQERAKSAVLDLDPRLRPPAERRSPFAIVAHRGVTTEAPENTVEAFEAAVALGADAIELDVRLTAEVTSYEPALLLQMRRLCPGLEVDLLFPRSEPWMNLDVVAYQACHRARLAQARAVHLHPTQLSPEVVEVVRGQGVDIHAWDVNDDAGLRTAAAFDILRVCTDDFPRACAYRKQAGF